MRPAVRRRSLLAICAATAAGLVTASAATGTPLRFRPSGQPTPEEAWRMLEAGNARFVDGRQVHPHEQLAWRETLVDGQHPVACVLGCADSRVSPELVFDHGLGDLFTVRSVGEVLDDAIVGSIEYAVEHLQVPLVVVLGHAGCGAVRAAIDLVRGDGTVTGAVNTVARAIEAAVRSTPPDPDDGAFLANCVRNQALRVRAELAERSTAISKSPAVIAAAVYDLRTGRVQRLA
jgi:carbonic anhydrase